MEEVFISQRFCGPPNSGNGGYSCGLLAKNINGACQVRLHQPPPLETSLSISKKNDEWFLKNGEQLIGSAKSTHLDLVPPCPPTLEQASRAKQLYKGHQQHSFPSCFVCGPKRAMDDGLRLFCGSVEGREMVACDWQPKPDLLDDNGYVKDEFIWSALDCPSYFALNSETICLLGQMTAVIDRPVPADKSLIIYEWKRAIDGCKHYSAAAISTTEGEVLARARQLWIELKQ